MADVFLSYARGARGAAAEALQDALAAAGVSVFRDEHSIPVGAPFPGHLADAVCDARVVVVFADPAYFQRFWCVAEFMLAVAPYRVAPTDRASTEHLVFALGEGVEDVLVHLPPPAAQVSWPGAGDTDTLAAMVRERLANVEVAVGERLRGVHDEAVERLRKGGAVPPPAGAGAADQAAAIRHVYDLPETRGSGFVGRDAELWLLSHELTTRRALGRPGSLLVEGADGLGKTQLAAEFVWRYGAGYPGGIVWIDGRANKEELAHSFMTVVRRFGSEPVTELAGLRAQIATLFDQRADVLWVVDDLPEHRPGERPRPLDTWCPAHRSVTLLGTSRRTAVPGFDQRLALRAVEREDAVTLLVPPNVERSTLTSLEWGDIVEWVGRTPLALVWLRDALAHSLHTPESLLAIVRRPDATSAVDEIATVLWEDMPEGTRSGLNETVEIAYRLLVSWPEGLAAARRLAWLGGRRLTSPLIDTLVDRDTVVKLARRSWVEHRPGRGDDVASWRMPPLLAGFVRSRSDDAGGDLVRMMAWVADVSLLSEGEDLVSGWLAGWAFAQAEAWVAAHPADHETAQAAINEAARLCLFRPTSHEGRGLRNVGAQFIASFGLADQLVDSLRPRWPLDEPEGLATFAQLLGQLPGDASVRELAALLDDDDPLVRYHAALSAIQSSSSQLAVPLIESLLHTPSGFYLQTDIEGVVQPTGADTSRALDTLDEAMSAASSRRRSVALKLAGRLLVAHGDAIETPSWTTEKLRERVLDHALHDPDNAVALVAASNLGVSSHAAAALLSAVRDAAADDRPHRARVALEHIRANDRPVAPSQVGFRQRESGVEFAFTLGEPSAATEDLYAPLISCLLELDDVDTLASLTPDLASPARRALADAVGSLLAEERLDLVKRLADAIEAVSPEHASPSWWRGQIDEREGRLEAAIAEYTTTIEREPAFKEANYRRAVLLAHIGQAELARQDLDAVLKDDPEHANALYNRAMLRYQAGANDAAVEDLDRFLQLRPGEALAHHLRGGALLNEGQLDEALRALDRAINLDPALSDSFLLRATVHHELGDLPAALIDAEQAVELDPTDNQASTWRDYLRTEAGD